MCASYSQVVIGIDRANGGSKKSGYFVERRVLTHRAGADVYSKRRRALHPLKIKNNDGFHLAHVLDRPSAIFLDFFTPA